MREVTITLFNLDELNEKTQETAIENIRSGMEFSWMNEYNDSLKSFCDTLGINIPEWSSDTWGHFHFQPDRKHWHEAMRNKSLKSFNRDAMPTGFCADETLFRTFVEGWEKFGNPIIAIESAFEKFFKELEEDVEYTYSDESIREHIEANEIEFLEDGTIWHD